MRENIHLACEKCTRRNYHTTKNKKLILKNFQSVSFVNSAVSTPFTKKQNCKFVPSGILYVSSSNGRAPDSKSDGWGFESLLACHPFLTNDAFELYSLEMS
jgi:hypothetical protein